MTWVRLDDQFADHPKIAAAGPLAAWLYVCGLTYSSRFLTDGYIPAVHLPRLAAVPHPAALAERLVAVGLWERAEGGYRVHDYLRYQSLGPQNKLLLFKGFALDLFVTDADRWGVTFAIRTGGAVFSHALVTSKVQTVRDESGRAFGPGLCPSWLEFRGWRVRHVSAGSPPYLTPEERDVFDVLQLDFIPPQERDAFMEARAAAGVRRA